jgi:hypothetical protein
MEAPGNVPQQDQGELLAVDNGEQPRLRIMAFIAHAERTKEDSKLLMRRTKGFFFSLQGCCINVWWHTKV